MAWFCRGVQDKVRKEIIEILKDEFPVLVDGNIRKIKISPCTANCGEVRVFFTSHPGMHLYFSSVEWDEMTGEVTRYYSPVFNTTADTF